MPWISGYYRKNGTYVRSHSRGDRNSCNESRPSTKSGTGCGCWLPFVIISGVVGGLYVAPQSENISNPLPAVQMPPPTPSPAVITVDKDQVVDTIVHENAQAEKVDFPPANDFEQDDLAQLKQRKLEETKRTIELRRKRRAQAADQRARGLR